MEIAAASDTRAKTSRRRSSETGAAITEFSMIFPLFLLIAALVVDFGLMLNQYYTLNRVAYTSSRLAAEFPQLERTSVTNAQGNDGAHFDLQDKIRRILFAYGYGNHIRIPVDLTTSRVTSAVQVSTRDTSVSSNGATTQFNSDITRVVLTMRYRSIWSQAFGFDDIPISVESEGTYLLR